MVQILQHRRNTTAALASERGSDGEIIIDTTKKTVVVMDGTTNGGTPLAKESDIPVNVSELTNDAGYITSAAVFSGSYNDLSDKPTLFSGAYADLTGKPTLFSGAYADLTGKPTLFDGAFSSLTGKPTTISGYGITDAFSGAYADLSGKPTIPSDVSELTDNTSLLTQNIFDQDLNTANNVTFASVTFSGDNKISAASATNLEMGPNDFNIEFGTPVQSWAKFQGADLVTISPITEFRVELGDGSYWSFGPAGALEFPDTSIQTGAAISIADLKTLVASANTYSEFQAAIAAL